MKELVTRVQFHKFDLIVIYMSNLGAIIEKDEPLGDVQKVSCARKGLIFFCFDRCISPD